MFSIAEHTYINRRPQPKGDGNHRARRGKKRKLTRNDWVDGFCRERLGLPAAILDPILNTLHAARDPWKRKITHSFLSAPAKAGYLEILNERHSRLFG